MAKSSPDQRSAVIRKLADNLVVAVYAQDSPGDEEWQDYIAVLKALSTAYRLVIFSAGGGPTTMQRHDLETITAGQQSRVAVVTSSRIARGIVTAIAWFNRDIKAFDPTKRNEAFAYLGLDKLEAAKVVMAARDMATELGVLEALKIGD